ncbi:MAG TPA: calcium-binding protein [Microvirga sp.]|jgi:Ca2+-binding RTX toxin-like protein
MDGEVLGAGDSLTVLSGAAIAFGAAGGVGISSTGIAAKATVFGDVAAADVGIRLTGAESAVFVSQSGNVTGGRLGVSLGASGAFPISLRNEGTISGYEGGVRLEGEIIECINTGTIVVPGGNLGVLIAAVTLVTRENSSSTLVNTGTIISGNISSNHYAVVGGGGSDFVTNKGRIVGNITLGAGHDRYFGQEGLCDGTISFGAGGNMAYGGRGADNFSLRHDGDRQDDFIDGGAGIDGLGIEDGNANVRVDLRITARQETGVGGLTVRNVENLGTGRGSDQVIGSAENNFISTWDGNDLLEGGQGNDTLLAGHGNDTTVFSESAAANVDLRIQDRAQDTGYGFDFLYEVENLTGGSGDDRFFGDTLANLLSGAGGNDVLEGGAGNDTLEGGSGTDTAVFSGARAAYQITPDGAGGATVVGPDGRDLVRDVRFLKFADQVVALTNAAPTDLALTTQAISGNAPVGSVAATLQARDADGDALTYTLNQGSPFAIVGNSLVVANAVNLKAASQHAVTVQARDEYGGMTSQTFTIAVTAAATGASTDAGDTTSFVLRRGSSADLLEGKAGHDTIYGGAGRDTLSGGEGNDIFVFDTRPGRTNVDAIMDFTVPQDSIWLDNAVFKALGSKGSMAKPQKLASDAFKIGTRAQDREDRIVYDAKSGKLYYDQDGTGSKAQVQIALLTKGLKMTASDFFVI